MSTSIKIGTRDSKLALWQAKKVQALLAEKGISSKLVPVKSPADIDLTTPLHQFGTTGIFTKVLDDAILSGQVDIAVHSLKDYPTQAPEGLLMSAVLERGSSEDILVHKESLNWLQDQSSAIIATGSIRRIAQWKSKYPNHQSTNLRGNVQTRLKKLQDNDWQGAIFAKAGLERLGLLPENHLILDWMVPAPAQGVIGIGCSEQNLEVIAVLKGINHEKTMFLSSLERDFLKTVEGGCSAPVGAFAHEKGNMITLKAGVFALDGSTKVVLERSLPLNKSHSLGISTAKEVLDLGGKEIMDQIKYA